MSQFYDKIPREDSEIYPFSCIFQYTLCKYLVNLNLIYSMICAFPEKISSFKDLSTNSDEVEPKTFKLARF